MLYNTNIQKTDPIPRWKVNVFSGYSIGRNVMASYDQLHFLIGSWLSPVSGQPGKGVSGSSVFHYDLGGKVIVRKSRAEFAPEPGSSKGLVHEDLMVIYKQPGEAQFRAIYFDNEEHIIHYTLVFPEKQPAVVFESEASDVSPRARLMYAVHPDGTLETEFSVAAPGGELLSHVKGTLIKKA
jgi:hypothetical protein